MRKAAALALVIALGIPTISLARARRATEPAKQGSLVSERSPVQSIHGTIVGVNERARLVTVRDDVGQVVTVAWTDFTRLAGDQVRVGNIIWLDMTEQGDRPVAVSMTIQAKKPY